MPTAAARSTSPCGWWPAHPADRPPASATAQRYRSAVADREFDAVQPAGAEPLGLACFGDVRHGVGDRVEDQLDLQPGQVGAEAAYSASCSHKSFFFPSIFFYLSLVFLCCLPFFRIWLPSFSLFFRFPFLFLVLSSLSSSFFFFLLFFFFFLAFFLFFLLGALFSFFFSFFFFFSFSSFFSFFFFSLFFFFFFFFFSLSLFLFLFFFFYLFFPFSFFFFFSFLLFFFLLFFFFFLFFLLFS